MNEPLPLMLVPLTVDFRVGGCWMYGSMGSRSFASKVSGLWTRVFCDHRADLLQCKGDWDLHNGLALRNYASACSAAD